MVSPQGFEPWAPRLKVMVKLIVAVSHFVSNHSQTSQEPHISVAFQMMPRQDAFQVVSNHAGLLMPR